MIQLRNKPFRPMLAEDASIGHISQLLGAGEKFFVSAKLDGIRAVVRGGQLISRTLKPIRNRYIQSILGRHDFEGLDGELIVGQPYGEGVFNRTTSGVMSEAGEPDFTYYVFDYSSTDFCEIPFIDRYKHLKDVLELIDMSCVRGSSQIKLLPQEIVGETNRLEELEEHLVSEGYEGAILKWTGAPYKWGRSTLRERYMLKLKRFQDSEAKIVGFEELMHNDNEATTDSRGFTVRSSHKANKRPGGTLGKLRIQDLHKPEWVLSVGSGFDSDLRYRVWSNQSDYLGKIVKYKYLPVGTIDLPRHPVFLGFRDALDLDLGTNTE